MTSFILHPATFYCGGSKPISQAGSERGDWQKPEEGGLSSRQLYCEGHPRQRWSGGDLSSVWYLCGRHPSPALESHTNAQIQIHKGKFTTTNTQIQIRVQIQIQDDQRKIHPSADIYVFAPSESHTFRSASDHNPFVFKDRSPTSKF